MERAPEKDPLTQMSQKGLELRGTKKKTQLKSCILQKGMPLCNLEVAYHAGSH